MNLWSRIFTALIALPFVLALYVSGGVPFALMVVAALMVGALEYGWMIADGRLRPTVVLSVAAVPLVALSVLGAGVWPGVAAAVLLILLPLFMAAHSKPREAANASNGRTDSARGLTLWGLTVYAGVVAGMGILLRWDNAGALWWLMMFLGTWTMDVMSYVGGKLYGKRPLVPRLSPNKTSEGAVTGIAASVTANMLVTASLGVLTPFTLFLTLGTPFVALIGDILESVVKRRFGRKDSHVDGLNILPGHGGMLDRIDSLMLVIVFYFLSIALRGLFGS